MSGSRSFAGGSGGVDPHAAKLGLKLVTLPTGAVSDKFTVASGLAAWVLVYAPTATTLTHLGCWVSAAGATSGGDNNMGIYAAAGGAPLRLTGDMTTVLSTGVPAGGHYAEGALTAPLTVTPGAYYLHLLTHFTTPPTIPASTSVSGFNRVTLNGRRTSITVSGQASSPSLTPGTATVNTAEYFFGAR